MGIKYHQPNRIGHPGFKLDYNVFAENQANAEYALGLLEGLQRKLQDSSLLISPLTAKEATVSSKIEGTQSTVSDVFLHEAGGKTKYSDVAEVVNYRRAMNFAIEYVKNERPFSIEMIKTLHKILLKDTRHRGKLGQFREGDVWIAEKAGDPIDQAIYVPPHFMQVPNYMEDLWRFLHESKMNPLIKAGILHYQFEAIHPFEDGNGRIGRLLIPLVLLHQKRLSVPILYISGYMEKNRGEYIDNLHNVDETGRIEFWLNFFFKSVALQLRETQKIIEEIYTLYDKIRDEYKGNKSPSLIPFLEFLFANPIFTVPQVETRLKISWITVKRVIRSLREKEFIVELNIRQERAKLYVFDPLIKILR